MKRRERLTLVDADKYSALVSRCTEQRERAERAEARIEALEKVLQFYAAGNTDMDATGKYGIYARDALAAKEET